MIISRLRIWSHSSRSDTSYYCKHDSGHCNKCGLPEAVEHVLLKCVAYERERLRLIEELRLLNVENGTLKTILKNASVQYKVYYVIIKYIKAIGVINRI